jgi:predicted glutamine amidotransferase
LAAREAKAVVNGDGCGIGWYSRRPEPGLYRSIMPAWADPNLASLCKQIESPLFFAHVRAATSGEVAPSNCHPFVFGNHLFMHNGQVGDYALLRRRVDNLIPDDLYPLRHGTSDSEAIFLAAAARGLGDEPIGAVGSVLGEVMAMMKEAKTKAPLRFAAVHSDGRSLYAYRWASDDHPPSLYWSRVEGGTVIASEPFGDAHDTWTQMPVNTALRLDPDQTMTLVDMDVHAASKAA